MDIESLKNRIIADIEAHSGSLGELSRLIHAHPELGFQEHKAADWLMDFLTKNRFTVEAGICEFPTAFRASYGRGQPVIALLAEYDALPELGHACGHNLIATCSVAAGLASRLAVDEFGGTVLVIGTPAEELYNGKQAMARKGAFSDLDAAMLVHPQSYSSAMTEALACQRLDVEFFGKAAHAAGKPEAGINALAAMILSFNSIDALRQHIDPKAKIHGVITDGGTAANIVPEHSAGNFLVRTADEGYLQELKQKVLACFTGAATATGARLQYKWEEDYYASMLNNPVLARLFVSNMRRLGRRVPLQKQGKSFGSTDFGNVSQLVPGLHAQIAITDREVPIHSHQFAAAAASDRGLKSMLQAAQALAMIVADLLSRPELMARVKADFFARRH